MILDVFFIKSKMFPEVFRYQPYIMDDIGQRFYTFAQYDSNWMEKIPMSLDESQAATDEYYFSNQLGFRWVLVLLTSLL